MSEIPEVNQNELRYLHLGQEASNVYHQLSSYDYAADPEIVKSLLKLIEKIKSSEQLAASGANIHPDDSYEALKKELDKLNAQIGKE